MRGELLPAMSTPLIERPAAFTALVARVQACQRCPRMEGRTRVLGMGNGPLGARVLFVGEAPGRRGGDRTGVPFRGDQSGARFEALLAAAGLRREAVFVTNAVLCNPRDAAGRNARPTAAELAACSEHLRAQLALVDPAWVVALGRTALQALGRLAAHRLQLPRDVGRVVRWEGRWLVALYHPGPRARRWRSWAQQVADFQRLGQLVATTAAGPGERPV
ncbi:MAG TPA: uracil-DNA glycosylase [Chloroflexota bacterium]|nr:uracil-DNA glycosylase [Chloroflexota bacterium]